MCRPARASIAIALFAAAAIAPDSTAARPPESTGTAELLARPVTLSVHAAPLVRALKQLREQTGAIIVIDSALLEQEGFLPVVPPSWHHLLVREGFRPIPAASLTCRETRLDRALDLLLEPCRLTYEVRDDGAIWVLPRYAWNSAMQVRDYPVGDLRWKPPAADEGDAGYTEIQWLLSATCSPQSWDEVGGAGRLAEKDGVLRILQCPCVHADVAETLAEVRRVRAARPGHEMPGESSAALGRRMSERVSWSFDRVPLGQFAARLSSMVDCSVVVECQAVETAYVALDAPLSGRTANQSLGRALRQSLRDAQLDWFLRGDAIVITSRDEAECYLSTRFYNVRDLAGEGGGDRDDRGCDALIELTTSLIDPQSWNEVGGPGSIFDFDGLLCVSQSAENQTAVVELLTLLRRFERRENELVEPLDKEINETVDRLGIERRPLSFEGTPLEDALRELSMRFEVPLDISQSDVKERAPLASLTLPPGRYTLAEALQAAEPIPLGWFPGSEQFAVEEFEEAFAEFENFYPTRFYDLRDLARLPGSFRVTPARARRMLCQTIAPESWDAVGGAGSVQIYRGALIVSQTWTVHRRIERLFEQVRARQRR